MYLIKCKREYRARVGVRAAVLGALLTIVVATQVAWAGPGGALVQAFAASWWTKGGLALIAVGGLVFAWGQLAERRAIRKTTAFMAGLAPEFPQFDWSLWQARLTTTIVEFYEAWSQGDLSPVRSAVLPDYFTSQQARLGRWRAQGQRNHLEYLRLPRIQPLRVEVENEMLPSILYVLVSGAGIDYVERVADGRVLRGSRGRESLEKIWTFIWDGDGWRLAGIDDSSDALLITGQPCVHDTTFLRQSPPGVPAALMRAVPCRRKRRPAEPRVSARTTEREQHSG